MSDQLNLALLLGAGVLLISVAAVRLSTRLVADLATDDEAARLDLAPGSPVMRSDAVDGLPDGTPLQVLTSTFAAARVEMVIAPEAGAPTIKGL